MNSSFSQYSASTTASGPKTTIGLQTLIADWVEFFKWEVVALDPISVIVGIPLSLLIIFLMPFTDIKPKPKMFYVLLSTCNLGPQVFQQTLVMFYNVLGAFNIDLTSVYLEGLSAELCEFSRFADASGDCETVYLLILFAFERFVAITFPFKAHIFSMKRSAICCTVIIASSLAFNGLNFYAYGPAPGNLANPYCTPRSNAATLLFSAYLINQTIPNCSLLVVAIMTFLSLKRYQSKSMSVHKKDGKPQKLKGRKTTVTMLALAGIRCSGYVPSSICYITWQFIPDFILAYKIRILSNIFLIANGVNCVLEFIVYVVQIPAFRTTLRRFFTCKLRCKA